MKATLALLGIRVLVVAAALLHCCGAIGSVRVPRQPRQNMGDLTGLIDSIRQHGVISPIVVEPFGSGRYRILTGGRRYAACKLARLKTVPCIVRAVDEHSRLELHLLLSLFPFPRPRWRFISTRAQPRANR